MGVLYILEGDTISLSRYTYRWKSPSKGCSVSVTTTREVFYGVISQGVAPYFYYGRKDLLLFWTSGNQFDG